MLGHLQPTNDAVGRDAAPLSVQRGHSPRAAGGGTSAPADISGGRPSRGAPRRRAGRR